MVLCPLSLLHYPWQACCPSSCGGPCGWVTPICVLCTVPGCLGDMEDDVMREVEVPGGQDALLLLGGIADTEVKGRTINTITQAELIFANGNLELKDVVDPCRGTLLP